MTDHVFRCVNLAAVSTIAQAADDKFSIETQLADNLAVIAQHAWTEAARIVIPGHSRDYWSLDELAADCPEFAGLLDLISAQTVDLIVCWRWDRLWRNDFIRADVARHCARHQVQIYATQQGSPPRHPAEVDWRRAGWSQVQEVISGLASEDEQRRRIQRMRMGMRGRIENRGRQKFARPAYGYMVDDEGNLVPHPDEVPWLRWVFQERAKGRGVLGIANELTRRGVPSPSAFHQRKWHGTVAPFWHEATLRRILKNPLYLGAVFWGDYHNDAGAHEPIISRDLFDRVQHLWGRRLPSRSKHVHWLSGLIRCGLCQHAMTYSRSRRNWYLRCTYNQKSGNTQCRGNWQTARVIEAGVEAQIIAMLSNESAWRDARADQGSLPDIRQQIQRLDQAIAHNRASDQRAYRAYVAGMSALEETQQTRDDLAQEHAKLLSERAVLAGTARSAESALTVYQNVAPIAGEFAQLPVEKKREVTFLLVDKIILVQGKDPVIIWA